ncbi:hypothetical protein Clacol_010305 [Clathrus columnatus]|uniref:F-box domain-containing protein n=1 Tax=Clathrus columnatus TaxID=1419009 RepID=A0AAV5AUN7_9AGAM|nr:hypothetical protein Clacol_010305 [Clathrus columnatus]
MSKIRQNMLVAINRPPVELFTSIILFAKLRMDDIKFPYIKHPFIHYTWVCHHWRSVLIQVPQFRTLFQVQLESEDHVMDPIINELLRRSDAAKLNAEISIKSLQPDVQSTIKDLIDKESKRIDRLWLSANDQNLIHSVFSKSKQSLMSVGVVVSLLPVIAASNQLDTLQCTLGINFSLEQTSELTPVFSRLRSLSLTIYLLETLLSVLHALHNNNELRELQLIVHEGDDSSKSDERNVANEINLPELQPLFVNTSWILEKFQTPKLSGLNVECSPVLDFLKYPIFEEFDLSSIKCLYTSDLVPVVPIPVLHSSSSGPFVLHKLRRNNDCGIHVIGVLDPIHPPQLFSRKTRGFTEDRIVFNNNIQEKFTVADITLQGYPLDYFDMKSPSHEILNKVFQPALLLILPRLTSLTELYLLSGALTEFGLGEILSRIPKVENNPSVCPRLKHLSYTHRSRSAPNLHKDMEHFDVGKVLAECLQCLRKVLDETLEFVAFGNCPPLSDGYFKELQDLGTTVIIEKERFF